MIEKLKVVLKPEDWNLPVNELEMRCLKNLLLKVDELVDAVNNIISVQEKLINSRFVVESKNKTPVDQYEEQRKWIGKLCKFRDNYEDKWHFGVLEEIYEHSDFPFGDSENFEWVICEPVKADDDIIYKGDDNDDR